MKKLPYFAALFALPFLGLAQAAEPTASKLPMADTSGYFLQLASGLAVVLLSIIALAWLLKRINRLPSRNLKELELIASLSVGQRERVLVVRAGNTQLVLGVAPGHIAKLGEINPEASEPEAICTALKQGAIEGDDEQDKKDAFSALIAKVRKDTSS